MPSPGKEDAYKVHFSDRDHGLYTSQAPIHFAVPVVLGRRNDMVFVVMFEKPQGVVICHGMGGGGYVEDLSDRHPAWDVFLYTDNASDHPEGEWNGRLVYKKVFIRDDILDEYAAFMKSSGCYWIVPKYGSTSR